MNLWFVKALIKEERFDQAIPILDKIIQSDPEYLDALQVADSLYSDRDAQKCRLMRGMVQAMGGVPSNASNLPAWGATLFLVRMALAKKEYEKAQQLVMGVITDPDNPILGGIYHLLLTENTTDVSTTLNLARVYHERWPDCLQISLIMAKALMQSDKDDESVNLLHVCASQDLAAQVPYRLWGRDFEFKPLYPDKMAIPVSFSVPAEVAGPLGMNALAAGSVENVTINRTPATLT